MMSRSILDDRGSSRVGVSNSESVTGDHRSLRERPHWNGCAGLRVLASDELELRGTGVEVLARWDAAAPAELGIVNLITHHDEEADEQLAGHGHPGLGAAAAMDQGAIETVKVAVRAGGEGGGLAEDPAEQRAPLLGDRPEVAHVGGGTHGGCQAHVAHDVLAPREAGGGSQDEDGSEGGQGPDAGMGQQQAGAGMGVGRVEDTGIEAVDMSFEPVEELEAILAALGGVTRPSGRRAVSWARPR